MWATNWNSPFIRCSNRNFSSCCLLRGWMIQCFIAHCVSLKTSTFKRSPSGLAPFSIKCTEILTGGANFFSKTEVLIWNIWGEWKDRKSSPHAMNRLVANWEKKPPILTCHYKNFLSLVFRSESSPWFQSAIQFGTSADDRLHRIHFNTPITNLN